MGVRGLSKFVDECHLSRDFHLHDTSVVIDGNSLLHYLYDCSGADYMCGGDYDEYAAFVQKYFSCLEECNIKPIVIFDGGYDKSDRMFKKLLERQKHRLDNIEKLISNNESTQEILPINAFEVFKNILSEMGILYAQCDYEGDNQMASLATHYSCPILSVDSDFYIYDLPHGFIRLNLVDNVVKTENLQDFSKVRYLSCKIYHLKHLLSVYQLRDRNNLSLLATLAGNDYASPYEEFKQFYYKTRIPFREKFRGLFLWLQNKTLEEAKKEVLELVEYERREDVKSIIENSIEDYKIKPTNMVNILSSLSSNHYEGLIQGTKLIAPCPLPRGFVIAFHEGRLPSILISIITFSRNILLPQFDDFSEHSSYTCSRYIRQVIYGILLQQDSKYSARYSRTCLGVVEEYDRFGKTVKKILVEFLRNLRNGDPIVKLNDIYTIQKDQLRALMANVMEVKNDFFSSVPCNLQLFFICINYWLLKSSPKPPIESLPALIICIIYFQAKEILLNASNDDARSESFISYSAAKIVFENVEKYLQKPGEILDIRIVHSFNQFQACVSDCLTLNLLLNVPFEPPKLHKLFNGTLLHNLTKELQSKTNEKSFVRQLLGDEASEMFYMLIRKFVDNLGSYLRHDADFSNKISDIKIC